ncbi:flagellar protein FlaG [Neobacillus novalis]|uniref:Flagellar protein FlaG n=1 Tax=Neobacillus novalis TaxID=220687 RepID=A0AA95SEN5_9BACI|nr:flagellar protein FlaG [Neobacillus novalis]WHY88393.1 flagellar protein FlaG [Neobacillus novalis]
MEINSRFNANQNNVSPSVRKSDEFVKQENTSENKRILETKQPIDLQPEKTPEQTKNALETFNKIFKPTHLEFQIHHDSGKYFVEIIDDKTKEVLKQIPSEEFLKMIAEAKENHGLIVDIRV